MQKLAATARIVRIAHCQRIWRRRGEPPVRASSKQQQDQSEQFVAAAWQQQQQACRQLIAASGTTTSLEMRPAQHQNGLFTTAAARQGEILMSVPSSCALIVDYNAGLSVPSTGAWPRLKEGLDAEEPLAWDLLLALALLDGLGGDGGAFWQGYCQAILPAPESLTLPMCWSGARLAQLQHGAIAEAAMQQQARLTGLFPDLMEPIAEDSPGWIQWALACVRSRAYKLGPDRFAMVPFWDLANHGVQPNADFREDAAGLLQLVAVKHIPVDHEVLISYTGAEGYTNQRLMAQYGFVIPGGNPADRVPFDLPAEGTTSGSSGLSLERLQLLMGDLDFLDMISAKNVYGYAALKSLPLRDENAAAMASGSAAPASGSAEAAAEDMELARTLLQQCRTAEQGYGTSLADDEAALKHLPLSGPQQAQQQQQQQQQQQPMDERTASALQYRVERKRLMKVCRAILELYVSG